MVGRGRIRDWAFGALLAAALMVVTHPAVARATTWERLWGDTAYDTMQRIVQSSSDFEPGEVDVVVVATGDGYWDALSASGLAGRMGAPVLITPTHALGSQARAELERLKPSQVIVMGGNLAIDDAVLTQIKELGPEVKRVWGQAAADTAVAAWQEVSGWSKTAVIATCNGYWDALSIAPYAYAQDAPIFLTSSDNALGDAALSALREGDFERAVIVGGPLVVSLEVEDQLRDLEVKRLAGIDAIGTSAAIARWEIDEGMSAEGLCVATVNGYWDALTGAALAGARGSVLVLANEGNYEAVEAALDKRPGSLPEHGQVLGGKLAVSDDTLTYLRTSAGGVAAGTDVDPHPASARASEIRRPLNIQTALFPSFAHGDKPARYQKYIMLHDTEELLEPWGIVDLWLGRNNQEVATHFVVGRDGSIVQCVPLDQIAFHAGVAYPGSNAAFGISEDGRDGVAGSASYDRGMNAWSVGIEICHVGTTGTGHDIEPDYPAAQLEALDELIAYIDAYYGFESPIIEHRDWTAGNPDCSAEFAPYLANYQRTRTHDGH